TTRGARPVSGARTPRSLDLDALALWLPHSALSSLAHRATDSHAVDKLFCDGLRNQGCVGIDLLDLKDVEGNHLAGELFQLAADAVCLSATTANHDARTSGVNVDANAIAGALDDDVGDAGALETLRKVLADLDVFGYVVCVVLVGKPVGLPVGSDAQT